MVLKFRTGTSPFVLTGLKIMFLQVTFKKERKKKDGLILSVSSFHKWEKINA
jgi:hypothetical protein